MLNITNAPNYGNVATRYSQHNEEAIVREILGRLEPRERFCVDIAAYDGVGMSNTLAVYLQGWGGLAAEGDPALFGKLAQNYAGLAKVGLARCMVTPLNVVALLQAYETPREFGFLNLDIDGYDFFVLEKILEGYRPALIVSEINENIPPPVKFTVKFSMSYAYEHNHFQGQSLAKLMELAERHNYALVRVEFNNAFLVAREVNVFAEMTAMEGWQQGYYNRPERKQVFHWNSDVEPMFDLPAEEQVRFLESLFAKYAGKYEIGI